MSRLNQQIGLGQGVSLLATSLLGTGIFVVPAIVANLSGSGSLFAWVVLIASVLPMAFTFALLGRKHPHAGGPAHLAAKAFGKRAEKLTALLFLSVLPVGLPAALAMATGFWQSVFALSDMALLLIQVLTVLSMLALGLGGARLSGQVQSLIAITIVLTIAGLWWRGDIQPQDYQASMQVDWSIGSSLAVMFWCFVGIEAFTHLGEEFKRPERDFPLALVIGVVLAGAVYWAASVLVLKFAVYGDQAANTQSLPSLVALLFGEKAKWLAALIGYLACYASINIYLQGFARLIWSLADEGTLPAPLAKLSANKVPASALWLVCVVAMFFCVVSWAFELPIDDLIRYANGNFVLVYLISMLAGVVLLNGAARLLALLSSLLCLVLLWVLGWESGYALLLSAVFWLLLGLRGSRVTKLA